MSTLTTTELKPKRSAPLSDKTLLDKINAKTARVGIMGMGYVGLPLARTFCGAGFKVLGFDVDESKVTSLNAGKSYIKHIPDSMIKKLRSDKVFEASSHPPDLKLCDAILICV